MPFTAAPQAQQGFESESQRNPTGTRLQLQERLQKVERFRGFELPEIVEGDKSFKTPEPGTGARFTVNRFDINTSEILDTDEIRAILKDYVGRPLYLADLYAMVETFNESYRRRGFVTARAYIPPQAIEDGVVQLLLVEGRVGAIRLQGNKQVEAKYFTPRLGLQPDDLVNLRLLEDALVRFNRLNDTQVSVKLEAGEQFGDTDIVVKATEPPPVTYALFADGHGAKTTGHRRLGAYARLFSLVGREDPFTLGGTESRGSRSVFATYELPVSRFDTALKFGFTRTKIKIVDGPFADDPNDPVVTGKTTLLSASLVQPFSLSRKLMLNLDYTYDGNFSFTRFGNAITETRIVKHSLGASLEYLGASGIYSAGMRHHRFVAKTKQVSGHDEQAYYKATAELFAYQRLWRSLALQLSLSGQLTEDRLLPSAEQYSAGGVSSVRAYEPGEFSGDDGYGGQLELQYAIDLPSLDWQGRGAPRLTAYTFFDHAGAFPFRPGNQSPRHRREDFANATGLGFRLSNLWYFSNVSLSFAKDLDKNRNNDVERVPRILFSLQMGF